MENLNFEGAMDDEDEKTEAKSQSGTSNNSKS